MIIDSRKYNCGTCLCGKSHKMTTEACIIEAGCLSQADEYIKKYGLSGYCVAIYDENTYKATHGLHPYAHKEIILSPKGLHADNHGVALALAELPVNACRSWAGHKGDTLFKSTVARNIVYSA